MADDLTMVTWLAPGLPLTLFERIAHHLEQSLGRPVTLESRTKLSGPSLGSPDPFGTGHADLGFVCAPPCVPAERRHSAGFDLLGLAPLFDDPRYQGRPLCFCDLVVRHDSPHKTLDDLRGHTFGYNDPVSLSGWLGLSAHLATLDTTPQNHFGHLVQTTGHLHSLESLRQGTIDLASIDSNVLHTHPGSLQDLRILESIGPWPSQPVVVRRTLDPTLRTQLKDAIRQVGPWPDLSFVGFRPQRASDLDDVPVTATSGSDGCH